MSGFRATSGTIAAVVLAAIVALGLYAGYRYYTRTNALVQDRLQLAADSTRRVLDSVAQTAATAAQIQSRVLAQARTQAARSAALAQFAADSLLAQLRRQQSLVDSLRRVPADTAYVRTVETISIDTAVAAVHGQWLRDSLALAGKDTVIAGLTRLSVLDSVRLSLAVGISATWEAKYNAQVKKLPPKWMSVSLRFGEVAGIVLLTKWVVK